MVNKLEIDLKVIIMAISLVIIAAVGSAYITFLVFSRSTPGIVAATEEAPNKSSSFGPIHELGDFTVNLTVPPGFSPRFVRCGLVLEVTDKKSIPELKQEPQIRDTVISILRTKTQEDIAGSAGMERLRRELNEAITEVLPEKIIANVYFTELVVQ